MDPNQTQDPNINPTPIGDMGAGTPVADPSATVQTPAVDPMAGSVPSETPVVPSVPEPVATPTPEPVAPVAPEPSEPVAPVTPEPQSGEVGGGDLPPTTPPVV